MSAILLGSYVTSDFALSDDGHGGTYIVDSAGASQFHQLVAAMATLGITSSPIESTQEHQIDNAHQSVLAVAH